MIAATLMLLAAHAGSPTVTITRAELEALTPPELGRRLLGQGGGTITTRQFCASIPGTFCVNGLPGDALYLSRDYQRTSVPDLCAAEQFSVFFRPTKTDTFTVSAGTRSSTIFLTGPGCAGRPMGKDRAGAGFYVAAPASWRPEVGAAYALDAARRTRSALRRRAIPIDCRPDRPLTSHPCENPSALFGEERLATMRRASIRLEPKRTTIILELWGGDIGERLIPIHAEVDLNGETRRPGERPRPRAIRIAEYTFVD